MVSVSRGFDAATVPRLHLVPSITTSSCSDKPCSESSFNVQRTDAHLNKAFSRVALTDGSEAASQSQPESNSQMHNAPYSAQRRPSSSKLGGLVLDMTSLPSQEVNTQGTQGFCTPVDQQFHMIDPESTVLMDDDSRSPAPTLKKRHRRVATQDADSDSMSQDGLSQSRSQGEPISASKIGMGPKTRPPVGPKAKKRNEPSRMVSNGAPNGVQQTRLHRDYDVDSKELGHGHYSIVYRATHRQCGKAYAIKRSKRVLQTHKDLQPWKDEVTILAAVEGHPNIVTYHDSWSESNLVGEYQYIKLELCGESLGAHVKAKQALPNGELWEITRQIASALNHIHSLNLVHLDVKPENIMRSASGAYKLGDFGHATKMDGSNGWAEGDARYMASEMLKSASDGLIALDKVDMFALGATLYELASGIPLPASGERWSALRGGKAAMLLPAVTHQLQSLMKRLMSPDPAARPDAASVLATCEKQKQMGILPLQPSQPRSSRQSL